MSLTLATFEEVRVYLDTHRSVADDRLAERRCRASFVKEPPRTVEGIAPSVLHHSQTFPHMS